jgi:hypothetical protein
MNLDPIPLARYGSVLASREKGRAVGAELIAALHDSSLLLDFTGVEVVTPPFFAEVLQALAGPLRHADTTHLLVISGMNEDVRETLAVSLDRAKMALATLEQGQLDLLGGTTQLRETLAAVAKLGRSFDASELANRLALKLPNLNARLTALVEAGALRRERDPEAQRGVKYRYTAPSTEGAGEPGDPVVISSR